MPKLDNLTGRRFGSLLVLSITDKRTKDGRVIYIVQCDCGVIREAVGKFLLNGQSNTCSKCRSIALSNRNAKHLKSKSREYKIWLGIKKRCLDKNHPNFVNYGLKGVTICLEWQQSFESFLNDVGNCPSKHHTLDRIENQLGYQKGNTRWVTQQEQARNKGKYKNNKTGYTGVSERFSNGILIGYVATWKENSMSKSKLFSFKRHGTAAFELAKEYRILMLSKLAEAGIIYSENHGK